MSGTIRRAMVLPAGIAEAMSNSSSDRAMAPLRPVVPAIKSELPRLRSGFSAKSAVSRKAVMVTFAARPASGLNKHSAQTGSGRRARSAPNERSMERRIRWFVVKDRGSPAVTRNPRR